MEVGGPPTAAGEDLNSATTASPSIVGRMKSAMGDLVATRPRLEHRPPSSAGRPSASAGRGGAAVRYFASAATRRSPEIPLPSLEEQRLVSSGLHYSHESSRRSEAAPRKFKDLF